MMKKILLTALILIGNAWLYTRIFWASTVTDAPEILANLYAKEICTCHFVVGFPPERCALEHRILIPPSSVSVDERGKRVDVRVFWAFAQAKSDGPRFGCVRTTDDPPSTAD
jgi:hypothetical protein